MVSTPVSINSLGSLITSYSLDVPLVKLDFCGLIWLIFFGYLCSVTMVIYLFLSAFS